MQEKSKKYAKKFAYIKKLLYLCTEIKKQTNNKTPAATENSGKKDMKTTLKRLLKSYDDAKNMAKAHFQSCEAVMNAVWQGSMTEEEYENKINKMLFMAGLTDENGNTDVYDKERIARQELIDFVINLVPKAEREILKANRHNVAQMDKLITIARNFANA